MTGSDQHQPADAARDELCPAPDESAQKNLAELGIGLHDAAQIRRIDFK
jgi:hypothetical protein